MRVRLWCRAAPHSASIIVLDSGHTQVMGVIYSLQSQRLKFSTDPIHPSKKGLVRSSFLVVSVRCQTCTNYNSSVESLLPGLVCIVPHHLPQEGNVITFTGQINTTFFAHTYKLCVETNLDRF